MVTHLSRGKASNFQADIAARSWHKRAPPDDPVSRAKAAFRPTLSPWGDPL
jgi:hypothetical protein